MKIYTIQVTRTERMVLLCLLAFLGLGAAVRLWLNHHPPAELNVAQGERLEESRALLSEPASQKTKPEIKILDLNRATAKELAALPHIGPALAQKIVKDRRERGLFKEKYDLLRIPGIGVPLYNRIEPYLTLNSVQ